jgi:polysaccharide deacetylase 2 family uncharacterized protein YibQ
MKNTNSARQDNKAANILGLLCVFCWLVSIPLFASDITIIPGHSDNNSQNVEIEQPAISIIIDDLGYTKSRDARALKLPGNITYSFLPHTPYARELAIQAHRLNKEVMLHQPMEALSHKKLGPGGLTAEMTRNQYIAQLESNLESVPYAVGINNHMGSLLTQFPGQMRWVMKELAKHSNLYFVDSYTTATSIGQKTARENWVPTIRRDVFLDTDRDPGKIRKNFRRLIKKAKTTGIALAIGHPYPETMAILEKELPKLSEKGIKLLPVSELLATRTNRVSTWRASLSP